MEEQEEKENQLKEFVLKDIEGEKSYIFSLLEGQEVSEEAYVTIGEIVRKERESEGYIEEILLEISNKTGLLYVAKPY